MEQGESSFTFPVFPVTDQPYQFIIKISDFVLTMSHYKYIIKKTYMESNKNKGYEYDADRLYSSQKDKEKQLQLEKESRHG